MLHQHHRSPGLTCDTGITAAPHQLAAFPHHPRLLAASVRPALQLQLGVLSPQPPRNWESQSTKASREYAVSCAQDRSTQQPAKNAGRGRTMCTPAPSSVPSFQPIQLPFRVHDTADAVFTFRTPLKPDMALTFPPQNPPPRPSKRCRAIADIDGEHSCIYRKKRRLRLFLITSRLSPEFSHPASNIVDRGSSKIAVWAKQRALGRNLLRKAAILNRIRRRTMTANDSEGLLERPPLDKEKEKTHLELLKLTLIEDIHTHPVGETIPSFPPAATTAAGSPVKDSKPSKESTSPNKSPSHSSSAATEESSYQSPNDAYEDSCQPPKAQIPRKTQFFMPPSPLGLSNYDAFDLEDDIDPYAHYDDDDQSDEQDEDVFGAGLRSPSAKTTSSHASTLSSAPSSIGVAAKTPPQTLYSDFNILDPGNSLLGEYDQIDEGAWPSALAPGPLPSLTVEPPVVAKDNLTASGSCSPNFSALPATSDDVPSALEQLGGSTLRNISHEEDEKKKELVRERSLMFLHFNT